jgi:exonuclease 3'-5' domain-containing protein 2
MSESSPEEEVNTAETLSPAARKRQLKAFLKSVKENLSSVSKTISQVEKTVINPTDPRVETAEAWVTAFKAENHPADLETQRSAGYATAYELRAYHLWHANKDLSPADVAKLLRTPPLKMATVANYIWCAVKKERLPVDQVRYNKEVVELLPEKSRRFARRP